MYTMYAGTFYFDDDVYVYACVYIALLYVYDTVYIHVSIYI